MCQLRGLSSLSGEQFPQHKPILFEKILIFRVAVLRYCAENVVVVITSHVMRNAINALFVEPKCVKSFGLHGGVIYFVWSHVFMNWCYTCSGRFTFGLCLFVLFSISDKVTAMISDKVTAMVNGIE